MRLAAIPAGNARHTKNTPPSRLSQTPPPILSCRACGASTNQMHTTWKWKHEQPAQTEIQSNPFSRVRAVLQRHKKPESNTAGENTNHQIIHNTRGFTRRRAIIIPVKALESLCMYWNFKKGQLLLPRVGAACCDSKNALCTIQLFRETKTWDGVAEKAGFQISMRIFEVKA